MSDKWFKETEEAWKVIRRIQNATEKYFGIHTEDAVRAMVIQILMMEGEWQFDEADRSGVYLKRDEQRVRFCSPFHSWESAIWKHGVYETYDTVRLYKRQ